MANNVTDLGKVGITMKGNWSSSTAYERLDGVMYDGSLWIALADNTNSTPAINNSNWMLSAKHGEFTEQQLEEFKAEVVAESKEEMDNYTDEKKDELDTYEGTKETELNTYTGTKKTELDTYAGGLKDDFDSNASTKTTAFNDNATSKTNAFNTNATNKTTDFNDNATAKTTEFNTNASDKTDDFDDNVTAKTTAFDEHVDDKTDEFDEHTEEMQQEIDELSANMPWNTTEQATEIQVTDAAKYSKNKLELFGNTEQDNTKMTYKCDGTETGDYYLTYNSIDYYFTMPTIESGNILVFDTTELKLYLNDSEITTSTSGTGTELTFVPAPNPDYPQGIHVVTGNNTVKRTGKNQIPTPAQSSTISGITFSINADGSISLNGTSTGQADFYFVGNSANYNSINIQDGKYILSGNQYDNINLYLSQKDINGNITTYNAKNTTPTIDINQDDTFRIFLRVTSGKTFSGETIYPQLEKGSTATSYEPYTHEEYPVNLGSLELCKKGDYQDYLYKENGNWYKYGAIRKYTECISASAQTTTYRCLLKHRDNLHDMSSTTNIQTSGKSKYTQVSTNSSEAYRSMIRYNHGWGGLNIVYNIGIGNFSTGTEVKNWFDSNETIYVVINTTIDNADITQITDTTLIAQLEAIYNHLALTKGINHITITPQDLAPYVTLNYMQDLPSKLDNLDSRLSLLE